MKRINQITYFAKVRMKHFFAVAVVLAAATQLAAAPGGTWTKTTYPFPGVAPGKALLLTDGSVLVQEDAIIGNGTNWYKLTPDIHGSYVNGTWTKVASIPNAFNYDPAFYASAVLPDGRVIIEGGEYNFCADIGNPKGAIYDPVTNSWTSVAPPAFGDKCGPNGTPNSGTYWCSIGDTPSVVLPDGTFMLGGNFGVITGPGAGYVTKEGALLSPPYTGPWKPTGTNYPQFAGNSESGWTLMPSRPADLSKLMDGFFLGINDLALVLTVETYRGNCWNCAPPTICGPDTPSIIPLGSGMHSSELYVSYTSATSSHDSWICLGDTQARLWPISPGGYSENEMGPAVLRPDGTVFQAGADPYTAILGTDLKWTVGPSFPNDSNGNPLMIEDGPAALLPNGNVLMVTSPGRDTGPGVFFELTPAPSNSLVEVPGVSYASKMQGSGYGEMLVLPTGQIWFTPNRTPSSVGGIEIYTPSTPTYNEAWAPSLDAVRNSVCFICRVYNQHTNKWSGQRFNGMSQGAAFGDDFTSATNYPLVRITEAVTPPGGKPMVYYCRTHDHSSMGVATGSLSVSTEFDCPNLPTGLLGTLEVVANGIPSESQLVQIYP
jgi:hypothetical protein